MRTVVLSLLFVVSLAHGAAAPPADDADALRRRIVVLELENAALRDQLKEMESRLTEIRTVLIRKIEIMRVEYGVPPLPLDRGTDMPSFYEYVEAFKLMQPKPSMNDAVAASLADKDKARTAEVVVRGVVEADPAQPKDEWPTYNIVVAHVFKAPPEARLLGTTLTVKSKSNRALKGPVTLYLVFEKQQKVYLLQHGERGFSHVGPHAALHPLDPALSPK